DEDGLIVLDGCRAFEACREEFQLEIRRPESTGPLEALAVFDVTIRQQSPVPPPDLEDGVLMLTVESPIVEEPTQP
ncbi:MAG: hypothetical protein AAF602_15895, partial [Myxococcota bacterium]